MASGRASVTMAAHDRICTMEAKMPSRQVLLPIAFGLFVATSAGAQDGERFVMQKTEDGYLRLDTNTGRMARCVERGDQLVCTMAVEEREAYDDALDGLQRRVETLEARVAVLESGNESLPSDEEFERSLGYMEQFFRRFMGIIDEFDDRERRDPAPVEPAPDRT
jgi:hypothetical protein